jgi:hypothetical protein
VKWGGARQSEKWYGIARKRSGKEGGEKTSEGLMRRREDGTAKRAWRREDRGFGAGCEAAGMGSEDRGPASCNCQPVGRNGSSKEEPGPKDSAAGAIQRGSVEQEGDELALLYAAMASAPAGRGGTRTLPLHSADGSSCLSIEAHKEQRSEHKSRAWIGLVFSLKVRAGRLEHKKSDVASHHTALALYRTS